MNIIRHKEFVKQTTRLSRSLNEKIYERLHLLEQDEQNQLLNNHKLKAPFQEYRSINITGDYRLVYRRVDAHTIYLRTIGTHHQLYGS